MYVDRPLATYLCEFLNTLNLRSRLIKGIKNFHCVGGNLLSATSYSIRPSETVQRKPEAIIDDLPLFRVFQVFVEFFQLEFY